MKVFKWVWLLLYLLITSISGSKIVNFNQLFKGVNFNTFSKLFYFSHTNFIFYYALFLFGLIGIVLFLLPISKHNIFLVLGTILLGRGIYIGTTYTNIKFTVLNIIIYGIFIILSFLFYKQENGLKWLYKFEKKAKKNSIKFNEQYRRNSAIIREYNEAVVSKKENDKIFNRKRKLCESFKDRRRFNFWWTACFYPEINNEMSSFLSLLISSTYPRYYEESVNEYLDRHTRRLRRAEDKINAMEAKAKSINSVIKGVSSYGDLINQDIFDEETVNEYREKQKEIYRKSMK